MAFKLNVKKTVDFVIEDEERGFNYYVKFHETPELGKTISISEDGNEYTGYPASAIAAIIDSLREENILDRPEREEAWDKDPVPQRPQYPATMGLPIPEITTSHQQAPELLKGQKKVAIAHVPPQTQYGLPSVLEIAHNVSPVESFSDAPDVPHVPPTPAVPASAKVPASPLRPVISENAEDEVTMDMLGAGVDVAVAKQATMPAPETPPELKEDAQKMMLERANALANLKKKGLKVGFKKAHIDKGEEE